MLNSTGDRKLKFSPFHFLIIIVLILGIFFRLVNLDRKVYWIDENFTSLRISGYTEPEFLAAFKEGQIITVDELLKYQRPNTEKGLVDTLSGLVKEEPQHVPLYFVLARFWNQLFGSSVAATRSLSAIIGLLVFPCLYWLCQELFESPWVGWVAITLMAVSPFHVLFAQEARPYSLWTVTTLLSSAALLRAIRVQTKLSWVAYTISIALNLYTFLFSVLTLIGHGIYVLLKEKFRFNKTVITYLIASLGGAILFIPWILVIWFNFANINQMTSWINDTNSISYLVKSWLINLSRVFFDFDRGWCFGDFCRYPLNFRRDPLIYLIIPFVILVGYSIYFLCRKAPLKAWLFVVTLIGVPGLALVLPDLISGGQRSTMTRYLIPCLLGIQIAVAYCLAIKISFSRNWQQKGWQILIVMIISLGIFSNTLIAQAEVWWNKIHNYDTYAIARVINQGQNPLLIYRLSHRLKVGSLGNYIMPLAHLLEPKVRILVMMQKDSVPEIPDGFSDILFYKPNKEVREKLERKQYTSKLVYDSKQNPVPGLQNSPEITIWKLQKIER
ncbi:MAG: glycosyltransferase family 39 protein [Hydrococcus sp. Prado102]|jgi:uncharacterized membrane protein|nr:glycosyltransferase family 39 protein [Hydrococcus sp. Prado102]